MKKNVRKLVCLALALGAVFQGTLSWAGVVSPVRPRSVIPKYLANLMLEIGYANHGVFGELALANSKSLLRNFGLSEAETVGIFPHFNETLRSLSALSDPGSVSLQLGLIWDDMTTRDRMILFGHLAESSVEGENIPIETLIRNPRKPMGLMSQRQMAAAIASQLPRQTKFLELSGWKSLVHGSYLNEDRMRFMETLRSLQGVSGAQLVEGIDQALGRLKIQNYMFVLEWIHDLEAEVGFIAVRHFVSLPELKAELQGKKGEARLKVFIKTFASSVYGLRGVLNPSSGELSLRSDIEGIEVEVEALDQLYLTTKRILFELGTIQEESTSRIKRLNFSVTNRMAEQAEAIQSGFKSLFEIVRELREKIGISRDIKQDV